MPKQPDLTIPESAPGYLDPIPALLDAARAAQARVAMLEEAYRSAEEAEIGAERSYNLAIRDGSDVEVSGRGRASQLAKSGLLDSVEVGGRRMVTIANVNERKANPPAPHRPRGQ